MKSTLLRIAGLLVLTLTVILSVGAQGLYWESTTTAMGMQQTSQTYYLPKMFKSVGAGMAGNAVMVFRLDKSLMYEIHPTEKTYSEITFAELEAAMKGMTGQLDEKMAEMKKQMEGLPPEQRKMMEQMMGSKMPGMAGAQGSMEVTNTGQSQRVGGYTCSKFVIKQGANEVATVWATREVSGFESMRNDFSEFSKRLAINNIASAMAEAMKKVDGFPIQTETSQGMKQVVTKVEKRSIAASEFEVPAGYTKVKSEMIGK